MYLINKGEYMENRPFGVTLIGILWIILGFFILLMGVTFGALISLFSGIFGIAAGAVIVLFGLITLALGVGCFKGWPWIWTVGVLFTGINLVMAIISLLATGGVSLISLLLSVIILYYLFQPGVKAWFKKE